MASHQKMLLKVLSPAIIAKAIHLFDQATSIVVGLTWVGALLMMLFAIYTLNLAATAKKNVIETLATEPNLPTVTGRPIDPRMVQTMVDRLQHRYPGVLFTLQGQTLTVVANEGPRFRDWITALSYIDTISPELHWTIRDFCVGDCVGGRLMSAILVGEHITFLAPQSEAKK